MRINKSGDNPLPANVNDFRAWRNLNALRRSDAADSAVLNENNRIRDRRLAVCVDKRRSRNRDNISLRLAAAEYDKERQNYGE
jgi:hypothetical protein